MKFNSINAQGNYSQAGKAAADDTVRAFAAARRNSPDYAALAINAAKRRSNERIEVMKAKMAVTKAGIKAKADVRTNELDIKGKVAQAEGKRMAGVLGGAGKLFATIPSAGGDKPYEPYKSGIDYGAEADALEAEAAQIRSGVEQDTPAPTKPDAPAESETPATPTASAASQPLTTAAPSNQKINFETVMEMADNAGAQYPGLVAAQWQLETGGTSGQGPTANNNIFAQKGGDFKADTMEHDGSGLVSAPGEGWASYESPQEAVNFLVNNWYKDSKHGAGVESAGGSRAGAASQLVSQGYATDPKYGEKLLNILNSRGL